MSLSQEIKRKALELGFDLVGITNASPIDAKQVELLAEWLKSGCAGQMSYLHSNFERRTQPTKLLENAQSIICVALNYKPPKQKPKPPDATTSIGKVANYAQYEDYHPFIKERLRKLTEFISSVTGRGHKFKICVDSAPLAERALAVRAGLGFFGKNHMLINPKLGPQIFLGEIITTLKLPTDELITNNCSNCDKCISACPTGALMPDGQFDANKCINYLTIEYKGRIPPDLAEKIADRLFGCDDCVLACPYQKDAPVCKNKQFKFYNDRAKLDLGWILNLTQQDFDTEFAHSTIRRSGLDRLKRNARICLTNINSSALPAKKGRN
ncbi:MAG: tRNA epoxyqueuosine(34) reductase QueG [Planctomycetes bacterium]|nr:tRNA epoxyqueuosine(34) reductase QueG [Planctomycetota bacterium]